MALSRYALALGSNRRHGRYGAPACVIAAALDALAEAGVRIVRVSSVIATPPLGPGGRAFANAAAIVESALSPPALLALLKAIEHAFGRRRGRRWGARVIDLDIILWSGGRWPPFPRRPGPGRLAVPHAAWTGRDFVLAGADRRGVARSAIRAHRPAHVGAAPPERGTAAVDRDAVHQ